MGRALLGLLGMLAVASAFAATTYYVSPSGDDLAVALNVTQPTAPGFLTLYPGGLSLPLVSTINYSAGQTRANNGVVPLGAAGAVAVRCGQGAGTAHVVIDVTGYFQ